MNIRKIIREELQLIFEDINIPVNVGDEILTGKFKNKKTKVKSIDKNEKGDLTINDKPALKFRIPEKIKEGAPNNVTCKSCGWEWKIESDDKNPHLCHKCGYDNKKNEFDNVSLEAWKVDNFKSVKKHINENSVNNDVVEIFQQNPELSKIGTPEQYSQYLNNIFPNSKVKDIVYHGTNAKEIEGGKLKVSREGVYGEGIYVQTKKEFTDTFGSNTLSIIIDTKSPFNFYKENGKVNDLFMKILEKWRETKKYYFAEAAKEEFQDEIKKAGFDSIKTEEGGNNLYYILFKPEQTHILGGKIDMEGFKNFVKNLHS